MIQFNAPYMLWWLWAMLLPVIIHLWSLKDLKTIKVGSIQLYGSARVRKARKISPTQIPLMILRMLLIGSLILWLARPTFISTPERSSIAYFVEPDLELPEFLKKNLSDEENVYWLDHELSPVQKVPKDSTSNYWELVYRASKFNSDSIVVISRALHRKLSNIRPVLPENVNWIILGDSLISESIIGRLYKNTRDTTHIYDIYSSEQLTTYKLSESIILADSVLEKINIATNDQNKNAAVTLSEYLEKIASYAGTNVHVSIRDSLVSDAVNVSLDTTLTNARIYLGGSSGEEILSAGPGGRFILNRIPLTEDYRNDEFALELIEYLGLKPKKEMLYPDNRTVAYSQIFPDVKPDIYTYASQASEYHEIFIWLTIILLIAERIYALRLRQ